MAAQPQEQVVEVDVQDAQSLEDALEREAQRLQALDDIGASLEGLKDEAVKWRSAYELEWAEDFAQYNTASRKAGSSKQPGREGAQSPSADPEYRQSSDNITRPKVIITASRLADMLFPTNEANWALDPSPKPEVPRALLPPPPQPPPPQDGSDPGPPVDYTAEQLEQAQRDYADKACRSMANTIKDQFAECAYDEAGRSAIFEGCLYGTGVLSGPVLKNYRKHNYGGRAGAMYAQMTQAAQPCVEHVDLWSFYPQPSRSIDECEHAFRLHILPKRGVRQLMSQPGFDKLQIARLLKETPDPGVLALGAIERGTVRPDANVVLKDRYTVWQYRGPMPKDGFVAFITGLVAQRVLTNEQAASLIVDLDNDPTAELDCEVWFCQGIVIKMAPSTLDPGEIGYYVWNYETDPNSIFGRGVPYLCRDDAHAVGQLWRAMMLNSMMSAGPQIGVRKGSLVAQGPRDTTLTADKPRVWALNDDVQDIRQALSVFVIPNVTKDILGLYERAKANADEHTMTPMIAQGEPTQAVPTSSGMAMLMNAANVVMRRLAKGWDDSITRPLVEAFYDWNMANNPDPSIRGDYCVIPKGASYLLIKDVQAQHLQFATQLFSANPLLQPYMKPGVFATKNIEMLDLTPEEMLYTDEEVQQQQAQRGQQPSPDELKAQAALAAAKASEARAAADTQLAQHKMDFDKLDREMQHDERMADIAARERIQAMQLKGAQLALLADMAKMKSNERIQMQKIIADLQKHGGTLDLGQYVADSNAQIRAEEIASNEQNIEKQVAASSNPKVS